MTARKITFEDCNTLATCSSCGNVYAKIGRRPLPDCYNCGTALTIDEPGTHRINSGIPHRICTGCHHIWELRDPKNWRCPLCNCKTNILIPAEET